MKKLGFLGWYIILLLIIIVLSIAWCNRIKEVKNISHIQESKLENTITTEFKIQKNIEHVQDSIFTSQQAIISKQYKLPRTSKMLPNRNEMDSNSVFKVVGSKVTEDTNTYDSIRMLLIYKELLNDSLIETTNDLKFKVIEERISRAKSDSAFKALLDLKDERIDSLSKLRTHKFGNNAKWFLKGFAFGFIGGVSVPK